MLKYRISFLLGTFFIVDIIASADVVKILKCILIPD